MSGHTPGPWEAKGRLVYAEGVVDTCSAVANGCIVYCEETQQSDHDGRIWFTGGDACANALLISAAPELLKAAKAFVPAGVSLSNHNVPDDTVIPLDATIGELRKIAAAIAKAEGRQ